MTTASPNELGAGRLIGVRRDFTLMWTGQAVSSLGSAAALVAYPLLVLRTSHSAARAGLVMSVAMVAQLAVALPGGALIDRMDKRRMMLICDAVRMIAQGGLCLAVAAHRADLALLLAVAAVDSCMTALFVAAEPTAVRYVVHEGQLPLALARIEAREAAAMLLGPALGGLLFALGSALPFVANGLSYAVSFGCLAFVRTAMAPTAAAAAARGWRGMTEGLLWIWRQPFMRVTLLLISGTNLVSNSLLLVAIVICGAQGRSGAQTGLLFSFAGVGSLAGALLAPRLVSALSVRTILVVNRVLWAALIAPLSFLRDPYAIGALVGLMFLMGPTGTTAVRARQIALTPKQLQGRVSSARGLCTGLAAPLGTGAIGVVLQQLGVKTAVLALIAWLALMATIAIMSSSVKGA